ncbi:hypothetical protein J6590_060974 [Homalodisca vitripennis]|nr:hypothetical protein J6590_060974 [Homalodisca vitripennis]
MRAAILSNLDEEVFSLYLWEASCWVNLIDSFVVWVSYDKELVFNIFIVNLLCLLKRMWTPDSRSEVCDRQNADPVLSGKGNGAKFNIRIE